MPPFLFPTGHSERTTDQGAFYCPACREPRDYRRVVVGRVVRVFAIQLPAGIYGQYVECTGCLATFRPSALALRPEDPGPDTAAEYERALLRVLALLVISDGHIDDAEIRVVQRVYGSVTGTQLTREAVIAEARDVAEHPTTAARYLSRIVGYLNDHGREQILRGAALVSGADGRVVQVEEDLVRRLGAVLQLSPDRIEYVLRAFS
jgi:uncharacterized tellurite resistance protein B-like protein